MSVENLETLELVSTASLILYVVFIALEKKIAWPLGIIGSAIGSYVMYKSQYQAESFLYLYYVIAGFYGWYVWESRTSDDFKIGEWGLKTHLLVGVLGIILTFGLAEFISLVFPENPRPLIDSFTTMFSFIATYMQIKKILSNWWYWIVINSVTIYLYYSRGLDYYTVLALVNTILASAGAYSWHKRKV